MSATSLTFLFMFEVKNSWQNETCMLSYNVGKRRSNSSCTERAFKFTELCVKVLNIL